MNLQIIITQGPYSSTMSQLAGLEGFAGLRLNTVMPVERDRHAERLASLRDAARGKPVWVDLKARQLRVQGFANVPYTALRISHRVRCELPATAYLDNGRLTAKVVAIDGFDLILEGPLGRIVGPGESVNIPDRGLEHLDGGLLTAGDLQWVEACRSLGMHHYMLSFVESPEDLETLRAADPEANIMAKIESRAGLENLSSIAEASDLVLAARGDLYVEIAPPHEVDGAVRAILDACRTRAVVGSRILESLLHEPVPTLADLADLHRLRDQGVTRILVGDDICFEPSCLLRAIRIVQEVWRQEGGRRERCRSRRERSRKGSRGVGAPEPVDSTAECVSSKGRS